MPSNDGQQTGRLLLVKIGDGASPETFNALCGVQTRSFNMSADDVDTTIPDCENPENTPQKTGVPGIKQRTFTGSGKFVKSTNSSAFIAHVMNGETFNAEVVVPGLGTFTGPWYVTDFTFNGDQTGTMGFDATFMAADVLSFEAEA